MTPSLLRLRDALDDLAPVVGELELELVDDPEWSEPSDISYLTDADRANPDVMANVDAMTSTNELIAWFGHDREGFVGLWRGPSKRPLEQAPVVRLDSEGQYSLVAATIGEYLAITMPEEQFESTCALLGDVGLEVAPSRDAILAALEPFDDPNDHRHVAYNEARERRGLSAI